MFPRRPTGAGLASARNWPQSRVRLNSSTAHLSAAVGRNSQIGRRESSQGRTARAPTLHKRSEEDSEEAAIVRQRLVLDGARDSPPFTPGKCISPATTASGREQAFAPSVLEKEPWLAKVNNRSKTELGDWIETKETIGCQSGVSSEPLRGRYALDTHPVSGAKCPSFPTASCVPTCSPCRAAMFWPASAR